MMANAVESIGGEMRKLRGRVPARLAIVLALGGVTGTLVLAGCGSSSSSSTTAASGSSTTAASGSNSSQGSAAGVPAAVVARVKQLYAGEYEPPPTSGPPAQRGKTVWQISCGQAYAACADISAAIVQAGKVLGWHVNVVDGKADPSTASNLIKQAVAAHVDGILIDGYDCPGIKNALLDAKQAHIPVVNFVGLDCNDKAFGGGQPLFTRTENVLGATTWAAFVDRYSQDRADVVIDHLGGKGKIISLDEHSQAQMQYRTSGFNDEIKAECPKCDVVNVPFTFSQVPNPATQVWQSAIQSNPGAAVLNNPADSLMAGGLLSAVQSAGRTDDLWVMGEDGDVPNLEYIREGKQGAALELDGYRWPAWGAADTLNRIFAGSKVFPNEGWGWTLVDKDHNLPPQGQPFKPPINYQAAYEKIWNG
jgi:ribose transport system substrate-binding protein